MNATENISNVFSIFHDGGIEAWQGDANLLTLTIDCIYLAERINPIFNLFYVELTNITKLEMHAWTVPVSIEPLVVTNYDAIFKGDIEITSCEVKDDDAVMCFYQHDTNLGYNGGTLYVSASGIQVFFEDRTEITLAQLATVCKAYWEQF